MLPRRLTALSSLSLLSSLWLAASPAGAKGTIDEQALAHAEHAMSTEYLETHFESAEKELKQALAICGPNGCAPETVAELHRDLGVLYIVGMGRVPAGKTELEEALRTDPKVTLDPDLTTPELDATFAAAAASLGIVPGAPKAKTKAAEPAQPEQAPSSSGDIVHTAPAEQMVDTPVPLYLEPAPGASFKKVKVHYLPYGSTDWKTLELDRVKNGWGIELPCTDVTTAGPVSYFFQAYDESGDVGATSGSRQQPHKVVIVHELAGEPPHLPGRPPSAQCHDMNDCPPDFPGCESKDSGTKQDQPKTESYKKNWLSLAVQQDFMIVGGEKNVCDGARGYACFESNDTYYDSYLPAAAGEVAGGFGFGTTRILLGYDRIFASHWTLGARAGYAFGGGPTAPGGAAFVPAHGEGRVAYWFGKAPFEHAGFRPYAQVSGGVAQIDTKIPVKTLDADTRAPTNVDAWRKSGTGFASIGGGFAYAFNSQHAMLAELRLMQMLGVSATAIGLNIGYEFGL